MQSSLLPGEAEPPPGRPRLKSVWQRIFSSDSWTSLSSRSSRPICAAAAALLEGRLTSGGLGEDATHGGERGGRGQGGEKSDRTEHGFYNPFGKTASGAPIRINPEIETRQDSKACQKNPFKGPCSHFQTLATF